MLNRTDGMLVGWAVGRHVFWHTGRHPVEMGQYLYPIQFWLLFLCNSFVIV